MSNLMGCCQDGNHRCFFAVLQPAAGRARRRVNHPSGGWRTPD